MTENKDALAEALERARRWNETATDEEKAAMWKLQRESWARDGNGRVDGFGTTYITTPPAQDAMRAALEAVYDAGRYALDGVFGDYGWNITKLNRARPLIRAALSAPNVAGDRPKPYTKLHHVLHATGLYPTPKPESVNDVRAALAEAIEALKQIERLGSDGEHSGDRHARCRDVARAALAAQVVAKHGVGRT